MLPTGAHLASALAVLALAALAGVNFTRLRRKAALERARDSAVFRGVGEAVVVLDPADVVVGWNPSAERIYGWTADEAIGKTGRSLVDPEPISTTPAATGDLVHFEAHHRRRDGRRIHVAVTGSYAPDPVHEKVFVLVVRDVTEQRSTERALRESEDRLSLALAGSRMEVWDWDLREGRLLLGVRAARRAGLGTGVPGTVEELIARLVHPDDRPAVLERLRPVLREGAEEFLSEHRAPREGGRWVWVVIAGRVTVRGPGGEPTRLTGTIRDVTVEKELRTRLERAERLTSLGTLAAGVAHEVNNPLAYVAANLAFLREELGRGDSAASPEELRQAIEESQVGIAKVRETVTGLERFASPGEAAPPAPVDVGAELTAALGLARPELARRARLEVEVPDGLPRVVADASALRQVFVNLLLNAAQAIPEGAPGAHHVGVVARAEDGRLVVEVSDTGVGIAASVLPRIFDPFFSTKPIGTGTGLGLSVCHGIVNALGGTIEVESAPGRGARFRVLLPVVRPPPAAPATGAARRARVLIVDDEPFVGRALGRILSGAHDVTVTPSPLEALSRLERGERWDLMLCDLMMPELTGMELEARIAVAAPEMVGRIVFMTGGAFTAAAREFVESGRPCIEKPVDAGALRELVASRVAGA